MEIVCIADIHGDIEAVLRLKRYIRDNNLESILILGDFVGHGSFRSVEKSIDDVRSVLDLLLDFRILAIPGNCDAPEILGVFDEYGVNLHEKSIVLDKTTIVGFGGSAPTPFDTPFEMHEGEIYEKIERLLSAVKTERVVLAVHNPPLNTECDITRLGVHAGSSAIREIAEKFQPDTLLSSHIHEAGGSEDLMGKTRVANIGSLAQGRFGILCLNNGIDINLGGL
jgi:Icc-related predicted phosphoesterase